MSCKIVYTIAFCVFCSSEVNYMARPIFAQSARAEIVYTLSQNLPDTCAQGYVWREAFPNDHVCVTPETRSQAAYDNSQATARIDPINKSYGPDTCIQGYVWREAIPSDFVCVIPETRDKTAYDNSQAANRRVIVQSPSTPLFPPINIPRFELRYTEIPPKPEFPRFLGVSTSNGQVALSNALNEASNALKGLGRYANVTGDELNYHTISQNSGLSARGFVNWVIIELESNPDYHPPDQTCRDNSDGTRSCSQPLPSACYFRDPRRCQR
jgi:hypothetical protein